MEEILTAATSVLTKLLTLGSSITSWIIADDLAVICFGISIVLLAFHLVKSFIRWA